VLFRSKNVDIYFSVLTKKELLKKPGLKDSERKKIINVLSQLKIISIDSDISAKYSLLLTKYHHSHLQPPPATGCHNCSYCLVKKVTPPNKKQKTL